MPKNMPIVERFLEKVSIGADHWMWTSPPATNGYGQFSINRVPKSAHVVSYWLFVGEVPDGLDVHHTCHLRLCVNPAHLVAMTTSDHKKIHGAHADLCWRGHENVPTNRTPGGQCRPCNAERQRACRARKRAIAP